MIKLRKYKFQWCFFNSFNAKGSSAAFAAQAEQSNAATQIQRVYRGKLGRARLASKRQLDAAAKAAYTVVDANSLLVADVKELARRIIYAIEVQLFLLRRFKSQQKSTIYLGTYRYRFSSR